MARRRLTPPDPTLISLAEGAVSAGIEAKSMFPMGEARTVGRPPIAQVAGEASALAALEDMSAEMARARTEGRLVQCLALDEIAADHLVRDRLAVDAGDMEGLVASIRTRGQQVPVEVLDRGEGSQPRYGLISGWRRLSALREIGATQVLAIVRQPASAAEAYVAMVEENEIRADISFYERARIVTKALDLGIYEDPKSALHGLFGNVSRAKRSKIKSFMGVVAALDGVLRFPAAISEKAGLDLVRRLDTDPDLGLRLASRLTAAAVERADDELAILMEAPPRADRVPHPIPDVVYEPEAGRITITGVGVDTALLKALHRWLDTR